MIPDLLTVLVHYLIFGDTRHHENYVINHEDIFITIIMLAIYLRFRFVLLTIQKDFKIYLYIDNITNYEDLKR